jgi:hypothetical protein
MSNGKDNDAAKEMARLKKQAGIKQSWSSLQTERDARRLMDAIPRDNRSLTGRFFGDPLPGRSALDRSA